MTQQLLGAARVFASHYQIVVCDDPFRPLGDNENWDDAKSKRGFAGVPAFRMIGTAADLNDHWVELVSSDQPPSPDEWQRITCVHFHSGSGRVHVMSVIDNNPPISADVEQGDYAIYVAGQNLGIDQSSLGETAKLSDAEIAERKDIEWYRLFLVRGKPESEGRVVDR
ncbi:competence protein ComJ [Frankia sp. RB7]|nr:competence protein ComJ [Frankia sp. RB7]